MLTVAAAQPHTRAKDVDANAREHARTIREAQARLVVFPELSLTGYELDAPALDPDDPALLPIVDACSETSSVAIAGAPAGGHIAALRIDGDGATVVYRKSFLGGDELTRFAPGPGAAAIELDGWRIGLGICKDTGVQRHIDDTAALNVDLYVAGLVHLPEELAEQEARAQRITRACAGYVAFASFAGPTGGGYDATAAHSAIYAPDGTKLADAGTAPGAIAHGRLPDSPWRAEGSSRTVQSRR
jgi:predicted amidohydrolase